MYRDHVLVTGAAGGIGSAVVDSLLSAGYAVTAWGDEHDVTERAEIAAAVEALDAESPIDGLVHCAGVLAENSALRGSAAALERCVTVNLYGVTNVCQPVARRMVGRRRGAIVVVSSNAAVVPRAGMAAYAASKAAATSWTRTLALECAEYGVRCNVVSPGSTDTPMLRGMWPEGEDRSAAVIAGTPGAYRLGIPLRRIAQPADIAAACAFLLSPAARHITMHDLRVDGGATLDA